VYDDPNSIILGINDYNQLVSNPAYETVLGTLWLDRTLLFIGCSFNGLEDPDFMRFLNLASEMFRNSPFKHYALMWEGEFKPDVARRFRDEFGIQIVPYGPNREDLPLFLERINPHGQQAELSLYYQVPTLSGEFLGREADVQHILHGLTAPWERIIVIWGFGGFGKTRLAIEIARRCVHGADSMLTHPFQAVAWLGPRDVPTQQLSMDEALNAVATALHRRHIVQLIRAEKEVEVNKLLRKHRVLIIVDNFESNQDPDLTSWIQRVAEPSKVLITSRDLLNLQVKPYEVPLKGLDESVALELIRSNAKRLGLQEIVAADTQDLQLLAKET
jgi:hypothetical protein